MIIPSAAPDTMISAFYLKLSTSVILSNFFVHSWCFPGLTKLSPNWTDIIS